MLKVRGLVGLGVALLATAGCGMSRIGPLQGSHAEALRAHGGIPVDPGAPDLGQQPPIAQDPAVPGQRVPLSLLYTSDMHSRIEPFADNYYHKVYAGKGGVARLATLVRQLRQQNPNTAVLDSGDYLVGTPYFNYFKGDVEVQAMNLIGFDAITIGNHEFDKGVPELRRALSTYQGRKLSTNVTFEPELAQRYAVFKAGALRVGVFGLLTEVNGLVTPPNFAGARYYDPIATAKAAVAKLEKEADVVVCISHVGTVPPWADEETDRPEAHEDDHEAANHVSDERIAAEVPGIDVILSGHTHMLIKNPKTIPSGGKKALIVSDGFGGGFLGKLDMIVQDGTVVGATNNLLPVNSAVAPDPKVTAAIAPYKAQLDPVIKQVIGSGAGDFRRYSKGEVESSLNNLIADATLTAARKAIPKVDFALVSSGTPRNHILGGQITVEGVFFALPFDNRIQLVTVPGDMAREMLRIQRRAKETKRHAVSNVTYTLVPVSGGKQEIRDVKVGGAAFDVKREYVIAVTDYMADGGAGFAMLPGMPRQDIGVLQRDALLDYIREKGKITPQTGRIKTRGSADLVGWLLDRLTLLSGV